MKALVLHAPGDLRYEDVPVPEIGQKDVFVAVRASGICGSDIPRIMETGAHRMPLIPGHEFSGVVEKIGPDVKDVRPGGRVAVIPCLPCRTCEFCRAGRYFHCTHYDYLGSRSDGGFAEFCRVPSANVVPVPGNLDFESAALAEPVAVCLHLIRRVGGVQEGETVAVFGAGPIGLLAAQCAKALGAAGTFVVDIRPEKEALVRKTGAGVFLNAAGSDVAQAIRERTAGKGADMCLEASGSPAALTSAIAATRKLGRIGLVGRAVSPVSLPGDSWETVLRKEVSLHGSWGFDFDDAPEKPWATALKLLAEGQVRGKPLISHRFLLSEGPAAIRRMQERAEPFTKGMFILGEQSGRSQ